MYHKLKIIFASLFLLSGSILADSFASYMKGKNAILKTTCFYKDGKSTSMTGMMAQDLNEYAVFFRAKKVMLKHCCSLTVEQAFSKTNKNPHKNHYYDFEQTPKNDKIYSIDVLPYLLSIAWELTFPNPINLRGCGAINLTSFQPKNFFMHKLNNYKTLKLLKEYNINSFQHINYPKARVQIVLTLSQPDTTTHLYFVFSEDSKLPIDIFQKHYVTDTATGNTEVFFFRYLFIFTP